MTEPARTVTVTGSGTAEAVPDLLTVSIGVECRRDDVGAAYAAAGRAAAAISAILREHGVPDPDITTSGLNVRADVVWKEGQGQTVAGYVASSILAVRLRDVPGSSDVIAGAVAAGGNDDGLELGFADPAAVTAQAREAAWQDALATARQFASLAGTELGPVVSVTQQPGPSGPIPMAKMQRAMATDSVGIEAGQSSVSATVEVVWELRQTS